MAKSGTNRLASAQVCTRTAVQCKKASKNNIFKSLKVNFIVFMIKKISHALKQLGRHLPRLTVLTVYQVTVHSAVLVN